MVRDRPGLDPAESVQPDEGGDRDKRYPQPSGNEHEVERLDKFVN